MTTTKKKAPKKAPKAPKAGTNTITITDTPETLTKTESGVSNDANAMATEWPEIANRPDGVAKVHIKPEVMADRLADIAHAEARVAASTMRGLYALLSVRYDVEEYDRIHARLVERAKTDGQTIATQIYNGVCRACREKGGEAIRAGLLIAMDRGVLSTSAQAKALMPLWTEPKKGLCKLESLTSNGVLQICTALYALGVEPDDAGTMVPTTAAYELACAKVKAAGMDAEILPSVQLLTAATIPHGRKVETEEIVKSLEKARKERTSQNRGRGGKRRKREKGGKPGTTTTTRTAQTDETGQGWGDHLKAIGKELKIKSDTIDLLGSLILLIAEDPAIMMQLAKEFELTPSK